MQAALHIVALAAIAFAQPVYDRLSRHADFFVAHDSGPIELLCLVGLLSVAPPVLLLACTGAVSLLSKAAAGAAQRGIVALLCGLIVVQASGAGGSQGSIVPAGVWLVSALAAYAAHLRLSLFRSFLSLLSPAALLFPALFLFTQPVRAFLLPGQTTSSVRAPELGDTPVVVLVLDELPLTSLLDENEDIDASRYPNFARFARTSHWFRSATTVAERTSLALPAILSGSYPEGNRLATASEHPQNLFSLFADSHRFSVFETHSRLCPAERCNQELEGRRREGAMLSDAGWAGLQVVLPRAWTTSLPVVTETWRDFGAGASAPDFRDLVEERRFDSPWLHERFLRSFENADERTLFFLHLSLPHVPWRYLPSGHEYRPAPIFPEGLDPGDRDLWGSDAWPVEQAAQRHLLQVGYADKLVGELLDALEVAGLFDSAVIAIVSDHGVGLQAGERRRGLSAGNLAEILCVPLMIKRPGQRQGVVSDRNAETIDLLPSIADALGTSLPWPVDGHSLFDPEAAERKDKTVFKRLPDKQHYERLSLAPAQLAEARARRVASLRASFGDGPFDPKAFAIGPHSQLIGSRIEDLRIVEPATRVRIALDRPTRQLATLDLSSQILPVRVTGSLGGKPAPIEPVALAVSLDGVVRATTRTTSSGDGSVRFAAMLPESSLRAGSNLLELFVLREDSQGALLERSFQQARD